MESDVHFYLIAPPESKSAIFSNTSLRHRITLTFHLSPFDGPETLAYIRYRLAKAGAHQQLFDDKACETIYRKSRGNPREINRICRLGMDYAESFGNKEMCSADIEAVAKILY